MFKFSKYRAETPPILDKQTGSRHRVVMSTRTEAVRLISESVWKSLVAEKLSEVPESIVSDLIQVELLVPEEEIELKTILARNAAAAADYKTAYLVIQPTAACQFGCKACGQLSRHASKAISDEHQEKLVSRAGRLLASGSFNSLQVGWFGAEPTLAMKQMRDLTDHLRAVAKKHSCRYDAKMVSNGYILTDDLVSELANELGISSIEVTIDGMPDHHDQSRPTKGGGPTFDRVFHNVLAIAKRDDLKMRLTVRCNVSRSNRESVLELMQLFAANNVQDKLNMYPAPIHDWGNSAREDLGSSMNDYAQWEIEFIIRALQLGFRPTLLPARKTINCLTFMPNAEMVDAYGNRFNCTEVSYVAAYESPLPTTGDKLTLPMLDASSRTNQYSIGHIDQVEDIPGRRGILGGFYDEVERGTYPCHDCNMLPTCGGHCPKSWLEGTAACPSPKFNISERLQIFYALQKGGLHADV